MKKNIVLKIKYLLLILGVLSCFYLTEKLLIHMDNQKPIMKEIKSKSAFYHIEPVDAMIFDNTIIPGINGKRVNAKKSLSKMENFGAFNETFLIYNQINPEVSLKDNKDKLIIRGNAKKRSVSLVLEINDTFEDYLSELSYKYSILSTLETDFNIEKEYLNGEKNVKRFSDLNSLLKKNKLNKKICIYEYNNFKECENLDYFIVKPSLILKNENIIDNLSKIKSGEIILINRSVSLNNLKLLLDEIKRQDLNIVYLSELISEIN